MTAALYELRQHRQWVNWKSIERNGVATKVPFQPNGQYAKSNDRSTWSAYEDLAPGGIGFVFQNDDPYIGIDLDGCRDPETGTIDQWAADIIRDFATYCEVSPSGSGVKLFGLSDSYWIHKNKVELCGELRGGKQPAIEVYDTGRYFAFTGQWLQDSPEGMRDVSDALARLVDKYDLRKPPVVPAEPIPPWEKQQPEPVAYIPGSASTLFQPAVIDVTERAAKYLARLDPAIAGSGGHNACFRAACKLVIGFDLDQDVAYNLLATVYNPICQPPWSEAELRHKVQSAAAATDERGRGYLRDVHPDTYDQLPEFAAGARFVDPMDPAPPPDPEKRVRRTRLADAAARYVSKVEAGEDDLIETGIPELDQAIGGGVEAGEMVIVAGRPSHGKSAIALQMVHHMTSKGRPAVIVSEEMSSLVIGKRTVQFIADIPEKDWRKNIPEIREQVTAHFAGRAEALILESCGSVDRMISEVEAAVSEIGAGVVVIDYVQLLAAAGGSRYEQVTNASQAVRRMASRLGVVAIVLAQLSRSVETRKPFVPQTSDLKESGQIEQDADVVVFGVWPHRVNITVPPKHYQFFVGKNRNREIRRPAFQVDFEPDRQRMILEASSIEQFSDFEEYNQRDWVK